MTRTGTGPAALVLLLSVSGSIAQERYNSAVTEAEVMPRSPDSLILDLATTDSGFIAVGERGHILRSENGRQWQQVADVPTRSTLTAVAVRGNRIWAAGHDSIILHSSDGGATWSRQHVAEDVWEPQDNNPLLDIFFVSDQRGFALGAYATLLETSDGGASWSRREFAASEDSDNGEYPGDDDESLYEDDAADDGNFDDFEDVIDYHLNAMAQLTDGTLYIAAERGNGYVSRDAGDNWRPVLLPYGGSMFGVLATTDQTFLTFGMRGHVFESSDGGLSWEEIDTGSLSSLMGGIETSDGRLVLVGANGEVLIREPGGTFRSQQHAGGGDLAAVAPSSDGWVVVGEDGIDSYQPVSGQPEAQP